MSVALLAALLAGMLLINLAVAWRLARRNRGPDDVTGTARTSADGDHTGFDALLAKRRGPDASSDADALTDENGRSDDPPPLEADGETVVCGHCGARNRSGYRYCRWCVRSALVERGRGDAARATRRPL
ncbi:MULTISPECIES: DUF7577 domain-containing protein [Haloferacaceae]|uniref:Zinc ribbon domain-containing protein n=1 Tax=Halorubrum glutamatedens TaxID=2707018 RepID=A0ABD5QLY4_9EURY|nr:zinc ribbon domain-containing protein [Halobellus captivus]